MFVVTNLLDRVGEAFDTLLNFTFIKFVNLDFG